jgi:hypothetical protein
MTKAWMAALLALGVFGVLGTVGAQASCMRAPSLQEQMATSPLVFVGTVVHGSPASGSGVMTSVDRMFRAGERDIFVLFSDRAPLQDNSCSATQPYTAEIAALAPSNAKRL